MDDPLPASGRRYTNIDTGEIVGTLTDHRWDGADHADALALTRELPARRIDPQIKAGRIVQRRRRRRILQEVFKRRLVSGQHDRNNLLSAHTGFKTLLTPGILRSASYVYQD